MTKAHFLLQLCVQHELKGGYVHRCCSRSQTDRFYVVTNVHVTEAWKKNVALSCTDTRSCPQVPGRATCAGWASHISLQREGQAWTRALGARALPRSTGCVEPAPTFSGTDNQLQEMSDSFRCRVLRWPKTPPKTEAEQPHGNHPQTFFF